MIQSVATLGRSVPELQCNADANDEHENQKAVDAADELAHPDNDAGGKRQVDAEAVEQCGENRNDLPEQERDDHYGDADDGDRVNHRGFHGALQLYVLFDVAGEALQNCVENTAGLARFHHVVVKGIKDLFVLLHRRGESGAAFDGSAHAVQNLLEDFVLLLPRENLEALHERQAGVDHHRKLPGENRQLLGVHACSESRDVEFLPFFGELAHIDLLALENRRGFRLAGCRTFPHDRRTRPVDSAIGINRHLCYLLFCLSPDGDFSTSRRRSHPSVN